MLEDVLRIVRQSGALLQDHWARPRQVSHKGRIDLVTETDVAVEIFLKEHLKNLAPQIGFLAEESTPDALTRQEPQGDCWIIDPVDGTTNFVHGIPLVGISVGLWQQGQITLGVVHMPLLGECFHAVRGQGAWNGAQRLQVSGASHLGEAVVATGFPYDVDSQLPQILSWMEAVLPKAQGMRRMGAASIDLAYVAAGRLDAYYEYGLKPWDVAAGWLLVEEAGGLVSNIQGDKFRFGDVVLASNGRVHAELRAALMAVTPS